ncbi:hypothetical protein ICG_05855 [Bacillus cereus BAG1X1-3]|nr:hypothetical protein ICG_05855 [Bacillus cereus BAG1X1-3]EOO74060.1 hypothetical protein IC7_05724 [Bacillus cereus BAG1O-1]PEX41303.1 hypothetical protein CN464_29120 [Bacillus cereus]PFM26370.1 hypothetical protein COJ42_27950 [Bacillus cereus]PFP82301.1 hypothetical protein COK02_31270 [Bacillus cereus]
MKVVEEDATEKLQDSKLSPYIEKASYKEGGKTENRTSVNININVDERFSDLETMEKYEVMQDAITKIQGTAIDCGNDNLCLYDNLHITYGDDKYTMGVYDKELIINDNEKYTKSNYYSDMNQIKKKEEPVNTTTNSNSVPSSSAGQGAPSTYDPKKDSANYDSNGNYKPVDQMKPEEIKKELEGMLKESLNR